MKHVSDVSVYRIDQWKSGERMGCSESSMMQPIQEVIVAYLRYNILLKNYDRLLLN